MRSEFALRLRVALAHELDDDLGERFGMLFHDSDLYSCAVFRWIDLDDRLALMQRAPESDDDVPHDTDRDQVEDSEDDEDESRRSESMQPDPYGKTEERASPDHRKNQSSEKVHPPRRPAGQTNHALLASEPTRVATSASPVPNCSCGWAR